MPEQPTLYDLTECAGIVGSPYYTYARRNAALDTYLSHLGSLLENVTATDFDAIAESVSTHMKWFMAAIEDRSEFRDFREDLIWDGIFAPLDLLADRAIAVDNVNASLQSPTVRFTLAAHAEGPVPPWRELITTHIDCHALLERFYVIADRFTDVAQVRMAAIKAYDEIATITMNDLLQPVNSTEANELFLYIARQAADEPELQACALRYGISGMKNPERHI